MSQYRVITCDFFFFFLQTEEEETVQEEDDDDDDDDDEIQIVDGDDLGDSGDDDGKFIHHVRQIIVGSYRW